MLPDALRQIVHLRIVQNLVGMALKGMELADRYFCDLIIVLIWRPRGRIPLVIHS